VSENRRKGGKRRGEREVLGLLSTKQGGGVEEEAEARDNEETRERCETSKQAVVRKGGGKGEKPPTVFFSGASYPLPSLATAQPLPNTLLSRPVQQQYLRFLPFPACLPPFSSTPFTATPPLPSTPLHLSPSTPYQRPSTGGDVGETYGRGGRAEKKERMEKRASRVVRARGGGRKT
jgi:hypothetical protein